MKKEEQQPLISKEAAEEFTQNLSQIMGGGYQQILWADKQGIPRALGLELPAWVQRIGGYIKYSIEERQRIIGELHANGLHAPKIAEIVGITQSQIRKDMRIKGLPRRPHRVKARPTQEPIPDSDRTNTRPTQEQEGTSASILDWAAQEGLESLLWEKVKDRVIPFWEELVESLEEDETEHLLDAIYNYLGKHEITKKHGN